ncbi:hypothetical protein CEQ90_20155 [Lewinellaceae bacterium SD302]|nr:hypothetical protein CEQ90_20155 [Lewinellaceae bacterium SD302]
MYLPVSEDSIGYKYILRPNGDLQCVGAYKNNRKHGEWKCFYKNGDLKWKSDYISGVENGTSEFREKNGLWRRYSVVNGVLEGIYEEIYTYKNDTILIKGYFENDKRSDTWLHFRQNGSKYLEENYVDDKLYGEQLTYYDNGFIQTRGYVIGTDSSSLNLGYLNIIMEDTLWYYNENTMGEIDSFVVL